MKLSDAIEKASEEIKEFPLLRETLDESSWSVRGFFSHIHYSIKLIFLEKEIIIFSLLQLIVLVLAYYLWAEMMVWLPEGMWRVQGKAGVVPIFIMLFWLLFCVFLASYPLGLFSGCIGAAHFLHRSGQKSTISTCVRLVFPKSWSLWLHSWFGFIQSLDTPKKYATSEEKAKFQQAHDAWKLAAMGMLPGIVVGKSVGMAANESAALVASRLTDLARLRSGYLMVSRIAIVVIYIALLVLLLWQFGAVMQHAGSRGTAYDLFILFSAPVLMAVAMVQLVLRPIYLISLFDIYSDYQRESGQEVVVRPASVSLSVLVGFLLFDLGLLLVYLFRHELGILKMLGAAG